MTGKRLSRCKRICSPTRRKNGVGVNAGSVLPQGNVKGDKEKSLATAVAVTVTRRCQDGRKRAVFIKAEQQRDDDGQSAAAEDVGTEHSVLRAENEQCDKDPKGNVTLIATSHIKPPVFRRRGYVISTLAENPAVFSF